MDPVKHPWPALVAFLASGCVAPAHAPENVRQVARMEPPRAQLIVLREAQVEALRERVSEHRTIELSDELCDTLLALASDYRAEAFAADPNARSVAPPAEREERPDAEEIDAPAEKEPPPPGRDEAALARLTPKSRALLALADRRAFDAAECLGEWHDGETPAVEARRALRRARLLDELGQRRHARLAWYTVIRRSSRAEDKVDAWLAFVAWYVSEKKPAEAQKAADDAAAVAAASGDAKLLQTLCTRAGALGVQTALCR